MARGYVVAMGVARHVVRDVLTRVLRLDAEAAHRPVSVVLTRGAAARPGG